MTVWNSIARFLKDPPPRFVFELSPAGIAAAQTGHPPRISFQPLEAGVLAVSPLRDNVLRPDALAAKVRALIPPGDSRKRREAALILPDYCARVFVLDFDAFPSDVPQQKELVRFRVKKSVPFDVDAASLSYFAQPSEHNKRFDVVVAVAPIEIVSRYEAPFRAAGFQPGFVTTSALAALGLVRDGGVRVLAKLGGSVLSIAVLENRIVKLIRSVELTAVNAEEITPFIFQTFAYVEDQLAAKTEKLTLCGFGPLAGELGAIAQTELGVEAEPPRSRFGSPDGAAAGLLGYLEALEDS